MSEENDLYQDATLIDLDLSLAQLGEALEGLTEKLSSIRVRHDSNEELNTREKSNGWKQSERR